MYWGDASKNKIETANIDGTGRRTLLAETKAHYFGFALHAGNIYFTDWATAYVSVICIWITKFIHSSLFAQNLRHHTSKKQQEPSWKKVV